MVVYAIYIVYRSMEMSRAIDLYLYFLRSPTPYNSLKKGSLSFEFIKILHCGMYSL